MRKLAFLFIAVFFVLSGCVISPRRIVGGSTGSGGSNSEFSIAASPPSQSVAAGATAIFTVTVQALNSFTGTVSLTTSSSSANVTASVDNATITGGSGTVNLSVQTVSTTPVGNATITVTGTDTADNVTQSITVTVSVTSTTTGSAAVPSGCITATAGSGLQRTNAATSAGAHGFTATFDATPSSAGLDAGIGVFATNASAQQVFSDLIAFRSDNTIQVRNGESLVAANLAYTAGDTYHFRLVENLPAATYSLFVTPPGGTEIQLGANLQLPAAQQGATAIAGWGAQTEDSGSGKLEVCSFTIESN